MQLVQEYSYNSFSPSLPFTLFYFSHLDICRHFLDPCYTCFEHVIGVRGYVTCYKTLGTCYLACYMPSGTSNTREVMGSKHDKVKKKMGRHK